MRSVKIREVAEALRCVKLQISGPSMVGHVHLDQAQSEMLAELTIRAMTTPTEEMLRIGVENVYLLKAEVKEVWEAMCREALR
jgi:hypothetical protein